MAENNVMKLSDLFSEWAVVRRELIDAVRPLTEEQLDWIPDGGKQSIGMLLRHISETEVWWFGDVVLGEKSYREYFREDAPDAASIIKLLDESRKNYTIKTLEKYTIGDFDKECPVPDRDETVSLFWVVWHVNEHELRHRGQIFMMMRLQGITPPDV